MENWIDIHFMPSDGKFRKTKISDDKGERNFALLERRNNLFFTKDGMYIYYTPTHFILTPTT